MSARAEYSDLPATLAPHPLRRAIHRFDARLRREQGVIEFSNRADCVLRIGVVAAPARVTLSDGRVIEAGQPVIGLHFWNEHLASIDGTGIAWGVAMHRRLTRSLRDLAKAMTADPRLTGAKAVCADMANAWRHRPEAMDRFAHRFGFEAVQIGAKSARRPLNLGEDIWLFCMTWAFNPSALVHRGVLRRHDALWISRESFLARFR
jgi:hypothetical protein